MSPKQRLKAADGAFTGRLLSFSGSEDKPEAAYRYRVGRVFKDGKRLHRGQVVTVWSSCEGSACGLPKGVGRVYGLFVWRDQGRWKSGLCGVISPKTLRRAARGPARSSASSGSGCSG
jgi:hypothetical protein